MRAEESRKGGHKSVCVCLCDDVMWVRVRVSVCMCDGEERRKGSMHANAPWVKSFEFVWGSVCCFGAAHLRGKDAKADGYE